MFEFSKSHLKVLKVIKKFYIVIKPAISALNCLINLPISMQQNIFKDLFPKTIYFLLHTSGHLYKVF